MDEGNPHLQRSFAAGFGTLSLFGDKTSELLSARFLGGLEELFAEGERLGYGQLKALPVGMQQNSAFLPLYDDAVSQGHDSQSSA